MRSYSHNSKDISLRNPVHWEGIPDEEKLAFYSAAVGHTIPTNKTVTIVANRIFSAILGCELVASPVTLEQAMSAEVAASMKRRYEQFAASYWGIIPQPPANPHLYDGSLNPVAPPARQEVQAAAPVPAHSQGSQVPSSSARYTPFAPLNPVAHPARQEVQAAAAAPNSQFFSPPTAPKRTDQILEMLHKALHQQTSAILHIYDSQVNPEIPTNDFNALSDLLEKNPDNYVALIDVQRDAVQKIEILTRSKEGYLIRYDVTQENFTDGLNDDDINELRPTELLRLFKMQLARIQSGVQHMRLSP